MACGESRRKVRSRSPDRLNVEGAWAILRSRIRSVQADAVPVRNPAGVEGHGLEPAKSGLHQQCGQVYTIVCPEVRLASPGCVTQRDSFQCPPKPALDACAVCFLSREVLD